MDPLVAEPDARPYPATPRFVAGALAVVGGLYFGAAEPGALVARGYPFSAAALALTVAPFVVLFALYALAPSLLEPAARRFTRLDLKDGAHAGAAILMATGLWLALGYAALAGGVRTFESEILRGEASEPISGEGVILGLALNTLVFVVPVLVYVAVVRPPDARTMWDAVGLRTDGLPRALGLGAASAVAVILLIAVLGGAAQALGVEPEENTRALEIARGVTIMGAVAVAVGSSVTEEIFFRGFLQPRVGLVLQAVIFSLAHLSYLHVVEILVTFTLALVFGVLYQRTRNLWAPIAGHFTFNLIMLLLARMLPTTTPAWFA